MLMLIPISAKKKGEEVIRYFPKKLRGQLLPVREAKRIWKQVMGECGMKVWERQQASKVRSTPNKVTPRRKPCSTRR